MKRIEGYESFRNSRAIKEEFIGKFWRNLTGKNKERAKKVDSFMTRNGEPYISAGGVPVISEIPGTSMRDLESGLKEKISSRFSEIFLESGWKKKLADSLKPLEEESGPAARLLMSAVSGSPDYSEMEDMSDSEFSSLLQGIAGIRDKARNMMIDARRGLAESALKKALAEEMGEEEKSAAEFLSKDPEPPASEVLNGYDDVLNWIVGDSEDDVKSDGFEIDSSGQSRGQNIGTLMKSLIAFQGKPYKSGDYRKERPDIYEEALGKGYMDKIDFEMKIEDVPRLKKLKEELAERISWIESHMKKSKESASAAKKMRDLKQAFGEFAKAAGIPEKIGPTERKYGLARPKTFLNMVEHILGEFGEMSIKEFFEMLKSRCGRMAERFTTSEEYVNERAIYRTKEGCGKAYHGGKISPTDLGFLFREQGGMYGGKLMTGANNWPTILGVRESGLISIKITRRVYEMSIKPGTKMVDHNPGGADHGSSGGLLDENRLYSPHGIKGMASKWYMDAADGQIPEDLGDVSREEYIDSALKSEVVVLDQEACDIRIVPFREVLAEYERLGSTDHPSYKQLKKSYPRWRDMAWSLESAKPGIISGLKPFTEMQDLSEIDRLVPIKSSPSSKAPEGGKADELVEICGSVSVKTGAISKFPTLLDYIIYRHDLA